MSFADTLDEQEIADVPLGAPSPPSRTISRQNSVVDWVKDTEATKCFLCKDPFTFFNRRHHCRACGQIICSDCSKNKALIPEFGKASVQQRVCRTCFTELHKAQEDLKDVNEVSPTLGLGGKEEKVSASDGSSGFGRRLSNAASSALRGTISTINQADATSLEQSIVKAVVTLNDLRQQVPEWVLRRAKGIAFLNMAQGGFGVGLKAGTGLMISRTMTSKREGSWWNTETEWSPPIAIFCTGFSIGFQVGGQLSDVMLVIMRRGPLRAFSSGGQLTLGADVGAAAGSMGATESAEGHIGVAGDKGGMHSVYTFGKNRGAFIGASLGGSVIATQTNVTAQYYGKSAKEIESKEVLKGSVSPATADGREVLAPLLDLLGRTFPPLSEEDKPTAAAPAAEKTSAEL